MSRLSAIDIRTEGGEEILKALEQISGPAADAMLRIAMSKGALAMKPAVKREAPVGGPGGSRMDHRTRPGDLRASISIKRGRRSRPPAAIVYANKKKGWHSHFVIGGTVPHMIRFADQRAAGVRKEDGNIAHPGSRSNPYMTRGGKAGTPAAVKRIEEYVRAYIDDLD